jgi:hypothetical protein
MARGAVGFTVKSGWAAAVMVHRTPAGAVVVESRRVELCDPSVPESKQPYHDGFATMRRPGPMLTRLLRSAERAGARSVSRFLEDMQARLPLAGAGIVVGSLIDPDSIGNEHIRIHAMEGRLFRGIVAGAVAACGLRCEIWRERDLPPRPPQFTPPGEGPWRREQKHAAVAACLVLRHP